ncbi:sigma-54 dependent transcriptional regulator, partial [Desulfovibrio sp. OttesenSCG-928-G15]|nr:sigma-54 dependent transcriptional regulator [Desulfovibrio sp. OttesenSCG-928-G15]
MKSLLVIDDEPGHRLMVRAVLEDAGWQVFDAASGEEGLDFVTRNPGLIHVALVDMKMPGMDGQETLTRLHALSPGLPVILLTAYGTVGSAVEAMKRGAFDYLAKPADNDELVLTLNRAHEYSRLQEENTRLRTELASDNALRPIIGTSESVRFVRDFIRQAGPSEATVLITGESGTGKELVADALHACSSRSGKALIKVNCAALPAQLLESELFGYERGAFTGAVKDKPGRFQLASGGTLFLDEIGEIPPDLQAKLLRAIQDRTVEPLGSVRTVPVDVRILAATNRNLRQRVQEGTFREDLFFRLNVLEVESPPLRERMEDLPLLVNHLMALLSAKNRKEIRGVTPAFLQALSGYSWPGNVRELENVLERALILSRSDILDMESLPPQILRADKPPQPVPGRTSPQEEHPLATHPAAPPVAQPAAQAGALPANDHSTVPGEAKPQEAALLPDSANTMLEEAERRALVEALRMYQGHREKTADALGISRRT